MFSSDTLAELRQPIGSESTYLSLADDEDWFQSADPFFGGVFASFPTDFYRPRNYRAFIGDSSEPLPLTISVPGDVLDFDTTFPRVATDTIASDYFLFSNAHDDENDTYHTGKLMDSPIMSSSHAQADLDGFDWSSFVEFDPPYHPSQDTQASIDLTTNGAENEPLTNMGRSDNELRTAQRHPLPPSPIRHQRGKEAGHMDTERNRQKRKRVDSDCSPHARCQEPKRPKKGDDHRTVLARLEKIVYMQNTTQAYTMEWDRRNGCWQRVTRLNKSRLDTMEQIFAEESGQLSVWVRPEGFGYPVCLECKAGTVFTDEDHVTKRFYWKSWEEMEEWINEPGGAKEIAYRPMRLKT